VGRHVTDHLLNAAVADQTPGTAADAHAWWVRDLSGKRSSRCRRACGSVQSPLLRPVHNAEAPRHAARIPKHRPAQTGAQSGRQRWFPSAMLDSTISPRGRTVRRRPGEPCDQLGIAAFSGQQAPWLV
jgi:hypothetical protein